MSETMETGQADPDAWRPAGDQLGDLERRLAVVKQQIANLRLELASIDAQIRKLS